MNKNSSKISSKDAYLLLTRFIFNPCHKLASRLKNHMTQITEMVWNYEEMIDNPNLNDFNKQMIKSFIAEFKKAKRLLDFYSEMAKIDPDFSLRPRGLEGLNIC